MEPTNINITPANSDRYTLDGDESVEQLIDDHQELIGNAVKAFINEDIFRALVLIGGYGRGEGGYCMRGGKPAPFNDYDYFIVLDKVDRNTVGKLIPGLKTLAHELEQSVGVEVDFYPLRMSEIAGLEFSLMFAEMQWGHRVVAGDPDVLKTMPLMPLSNLPLSEITRLMLNRGALLLLNRLALIEGDIQTPWQREIFVKYLFKAVLASGDAILAAHARYHPSYPVKQQLLEKLSVANVSEVFLDYYAMALEARFHPDYSLFDDWDLNSRQQEVQSMWLEALQALECKRCGSFPESWEKYSSPLIDKGQSISGVKGLVKNLAVNFQCFGPKAVIGDLNWLFRYPRERLISSLPLLLRQDDVVPDSMLCALSVSGGSGWKPVAERFIALWHRFS